MTWVYNISRGRKMPLLMHCPVFYPYQQRNQMTKEEIIPVYMLTTEIPADSTSIAEFWQATAEDTSSGLLMQEVMSRCPGSRKECHTLLLDYWTTRKDQCRELLTIKSHRFIISEKLHNNLLNLLIKVILVLWNCSLEPKKQCSGERSQQIY